jgi:hypothetical protein
MRELAGLFAIEVCGYVILLDWTGRELRADKRGAIPDHLAPIMERLARIFHPPCGGQRISKLCYILSRQGGAPGSWRTPPP